MLGKKTLNELGRICCFRQRETAVRFISVALAVLLLILILEIPAFFQVIDYRQIFRTPILAPWRNPQFTMDPELIYVRKPYQRLIGTARGGDFTFLFNVPQESTHTFDLRYDKNGFRNQKALNRADIAVLGDSFVEGTYISFPNLITSQLSRILQKDVANFGLIGYGPKHQQIVLRRYALPLRVDIVVWFFFEGNDLKNIRDYDSMIQSVAEKYASYHSFWHRSLTKNALQASFRLVGKPKPSGLTRSGLVTGNRGADERTYFLYPGTILKPTDIEAIGTVTDVIKEAAELVTKRGAKLLVAFVPTKYRVYHDVLKFDSESDVRTWVLNDLPERLRTEIARVSEDIVFIDLTSDLRSSVGAGVLPYFSDDSHWNDQGHRLAAQTLAKAIRRAF